MSENCKEDSACAVDYSQETNEINFSKFRHVRHEYVIALIVLVLLVLGIFLDYNDLLFFDQDDSLIWFFVLYIAIGGQTIIKAVILIFSGDFYNEFVLMTIATLGAFLINSYAEAVAVMLFYVVGELFQEAAVNRAKHSIEALLKVQVEEVTVIENDKTIVKHPKDVRPGQIIQVRSGEKVALDGDLLSESATLNTAALTGESVPDTKEEGEAVYAGMINLNKVIEIKVTSSYKNTKLSKILRLVQDASANKAKTQKMVSRLAGVYTPIVFWLAVALVAVPYFFLGDAYVFQTWFQRALIFLVISCPCALVISIPLGYFGGIGAGSRNGILFKGANYLDILTNVDTVVMDKTGTMTKGVFEVQKVVTKDFNEEKLVKITSILEEKSTHPIAKAIVAYASVGHTFYKASNVTEISGYGLKGKVNRYEVIAGNLKMLDKYNIEFNEDLRKIKDTAVFVAIDNKYVGHIVIADNLKADAVKAIEELKKIKKIKDIVMLSGDKQPVVSRIAKKLHVDIAKGGLLPEDKMHEVEKLKKLGRTIVYIGDGINDAPVITLADVGMAMGGLGSDAAIETADVIIQTDQPSKIATAIHIGNATKKIIWQNIIFALSVKAFVLLLGAMGMATMWEAVIADVGVAMIAIFNAVRIQRMKF